MTNLGEICQYCQERVPHYDKSFALFRYEDKTKDLIHAIKYEDKTQLVKPLSRMICRLIKDYIEEIDLIIPVPTHKNTLKIRKYNQALLIAREVSKVINKPLDWASLKKIKHIESQKMCIRDRTSQQVGGLEQDAGAVLEGQVAPHRGCGHRGVDGRLRLVGAHQLHPPEHLGVGVRLDDCLLYTSSPVSAKRRTPSRTRSR